MIQRRTQTEAYWQDQFKLTDKDVEYLYSLFLDEGKPFSTGALAQMLIERHCRQEEVLISQELSKGAVYQPQDLYEIGEQIIFPALNYVLGTVVDTRLGRNPDYGEFTVILVEFEDDDETQEYASGLAGEHPLNRQDGEGGLITSGDLAPPIELYEQYGPLVVETLVADLDEQEAFVSFGDEWFLQELLVPIEIGHLNIAEALVEIKGMPLPTSEFLSDLGLPAEASEEIRAFSLNSALDADERFDNVGDSGRVIWYLRRMTPELVVTPPEQLVIKVEPYDRQEIADELLLIEREIDDEGSGEEVMGPSRPLYKTNLALTYPHWRCGTLPLTVRTRGLFPDATARHLPVVLVDGQSGDRMQGWVVHTERFVYGLGDWYRRYKLPVGTYIKIERTRDPRVVTIDFEARRLKHLWSKIAVVQEGKLTFQVRKLPIACEHDDHLTIGADDASAIDELWQSLAAQGAGTLQIMMQVMPELISLSPQGTVHAKTIYTAVNILKRISPGPIFALLSSESCFVSMGGGYWTFDPALART